MLLFGDDRDAKAVNEDLRSITSSQASSRHARGRYHPLSRALYACERTRCMISANALCARRLARSRFFNPFKRKLACVIMTCYRTSFFYIKATEHCELKARVTYTGTIKRQRVQANQKPAQKGPEDARGCLRHTSTRNKVSTRRL